MLNKRFSPNTSIVILLGLVLITTGVWYAAYRAEVIGNFWTAGQATNY